LRTCVYFNQTFVLLKDVCFVLHGVLFYDCRDG